MGGVKQNLTLITWNLACCSEATFELVLDQATIHHPCWDMLFLQEAFVTQQSAVYMSVHTVELGKLSTEAGTRSKCPALVVRDSFPFEIVRPRASENGLSAIAIPVGAVCGDLYVRISPPAMMRLVYCVS